jgi:response regulator RpfG family c-di-GMP phosphodiesterase
LLRVDVRNRRSARREKLSQPSRTILFVDDEPYVLDAISSLLIELGYKVVAASKAEDAEEIYESLTRTMSSNSREHTEG